MAIDEVVAKNYQSHKKSTLVFSRWMNVILGPSDQGKSSIIRLIRWVVENRPNGDDYRRHYSKETYGKIYKGGKLITRCRTDTENEYRFKKQSYKALRTSVPEDIETALNLSDVNIQSQHEVYFLIDKSPGQISKKLNEVAGLRVMDNVLKQVNTAIRSTNNDVNSTNKQLMRTQRELMDLDWALGADKFLKKLESYDSKYNGMLDKYNRTTDLLYAIGLLEEKRSAFLSDNLVSDLGKLTIIQDAYVVAKDKLEYLSGLVGKIECLKKVRSDIKVIDITELEKLHHDVSSKESTYDRVCSLAKRILLLKFNNEELSASISESEKKYRSTLKKMGTCPTCGGKV